MSGKLLLLPNLLDEAAPTEWLAGNVAAGVKSIQGLIVES